MEILRAENISKKIGRKQILNDMTLSINQGEHTVFLGMNGCGKSIFLSILAGYRTYESGEIYWYGEKVTNDEIDEVRKNIGFISSSYFDRYYRYESVLEIVLSGLSGRLGLEKMPSPAQVRRAKELLNALEIPAGGRYPYEMLSKGQRQKALIARGLINNPKILILDEPCEGLDILARSYFLQILTSTAEESQTTMLLVSHYPEEILPFFKKAVLMDKGRIYAQGAIDKVFCAESIGKCWRVPVEVDYKNEKWNFKVKPQERITAAQWLKEVD